MKSSHNFKNLSKRSVARFVACQALCMYFDKNNENKDINFILNAIGKYYLETNFLDKNNKNKYVDVKDDEFTINLIIGVIDYYEEFDIIIEKFLNKQDTVETLDDVILQSFRLAIFELKNYVDTDKNVIINEYVDIIAEFYEGVYVTFANGILDNIALYLRENKTKEINKHDDVKVEKIKKTKFRKILKLKSCFLFVLNFSNYFSNIL